MYLDVSVFLCILFFLFGVKATRETHIMYVSKVCRFPLEMCFHLFSKMFCVFMCTGLLFCCLCVKKPPWNTRHACRYIWSPTLGGAGWLLGSSDMKLERYIGCSTYPLRYDIKSNILYVCLCMLVHVCACVCGILLSINRTIFLKIFFNYSMFMFPASYPGPLLCKNNN